MNKYKEYLMFFARDCAAERLPEAKGREIYDEGQEFDDLETALNHILNVLGGRPILIQKPPMSEEDMLSVRFPDRPYLVYGYFKNKYSGGCWSFDGGTHNIPTYEVLRCCKSDVEQTIRTFAEEGANMYGWGLELKTEGFLLKGGKENEKEKRNSNT